jgi:hypothetical protein
LGGSYVCRGREKREEGRRGEGKREGGRRKEEHVPSLFGGII